MFVHEKRPIRGIIFIILSVIFGLIAGLLIKKSAQDASLITTLLYRFIFAVPLLLIFAISGCLKGLYLLGAFGKAASNADSE